MSKTTCDPIIDKLLSIEGVNKILVVGVHTGKEVQRLIDAGKEVVGVDILPPYRKGYTHVHARFEDADLGEHEFDAAISSHTLEHMENVELVLAKYSKVLKVGGYLGLVVPGYPQERFHVGHYTLWTPALLLYNLVDSGWNCSNARYYTTPDRKHIGVLTQNHTWEVDKSRKGFDSFVDIQKYLPMPFYHDMNAWLTDKWD